MAIAEGGRTGEVRFVGEVENSPAAIERTIKKLGKKYDRLQVCFEAGPTGYGLCRQVRDLGHDCMVVAPALIPKRPGERVKTNRRDAVTLARLHRAGELIGVWVPDVVHEAVRDLVRAREAAADDLRRKRQQLLSFLLRHGRIYENGGHWTLARRRCLARQSFEHTAQQIVFQEKIDAIEDAAQRLHRLDDQLRAGGGATTGFRAAARVGDGAIVIGKRQDGCGQAASLHLCAVLPTRNGIGCGPVDIDSPHGPAWVGSWRQTWSRTRPEAVVPNGGSCCRRSPCSGYLSAVRNSPPSA
ncbi:transposase [Mesorhizobium sp. WSM4312]|uniref:IS110 family transposase n=1 Tax=Mesorhizobium sp. WSM4312 TaxID=2029411 RepID=UPI001FE0E423|nr:transposase [Mesorhizobium sp. WSM4312]